MTTCGGCSPQTTSQLVACCCCPCEAGQANPSVWDDLGDDASSFGQEDGRESDRHDTGVLGGLACLQVPEFRLRSHCQAS